MVIFKCKYVFLLLVRFRSKNQLFLALGLLMHVSKMPLMTRPNSLVSNKVGVSQAKQKAVKGTVARSWNTFAPP